MAAEQQLVQTSYKARRRVGLRQKAVVVQMHLPVWAFEYGREQLLMDCCCAGAGGMTSRCLAQ